MQYVDFYFEGVIERAQPPQTLTLSIRGLGPIPLSIPNNFDIIHSLNPSLR